MNQDMRSLPRHARLAKRLQVLALRRSGHSYAQIALELGLSRTGVFDICKRHAAHGPGALHDGLGGRSLGQCRTLAPEQELELRQQITVHTPDELEMPELLWNRAAVSRLIQARTGVALPVRTLAGYLVRWGFAARRPLTRPTAAKSLALIKWIAERYPLVAAMSKAQGGEINWGCETRLRAGPAVPSSSALAESTTSRRRQIKQGLAMISVLNNKDQLRWSSFDAPLDATKLIGFMRRLIRGASKKVFLILDDCRVQDESLVETWLVEHEEAIEAFYLPAHRVSAA